MNSIPSRPRVFVIAVLTLALGAAALSRAEGKDHKEHKQVIVPGEDRFLPFALTINSGDTVKWVNTDTDDHTVVSNDFFNTAGNPGVNVLIAGTDNNGGKPGTLTLHFNKPGLWAITGGSTRTWTTTINPSRPARTAASRTLAAISAPR